MSKCIRCNDDTGSNAKICRRCLDKWVEMKTLVFDKLQAKHGELSFNNHKLFIKESKRLESIWRQDKQNFAEEIDRL